MKHLLAASALFGLSVLANACGTDVDDAERTQFASGNVTYTVFVYDAQSGGPLSNASIQIQVGAQGTLTSNASGNAFIVEGVPTGTFPVTITADGYLPLTGVQTFNGTAFNQVGNPAFLVQYAAMYPTQSVGVDQRVQVYDAITGTAITNGQILAALGPINNSPAPTPTGTGAATAFSGSYGFLPSVIAVNITNGVATIPRDQIVYGGRYTIYLSGVQNSQGQYLTVPNGTEFIAGRGSNPLVVYAASAATDPVALSATNENNRPSASAQFAVTFPYPVEMCTEASSWTITPIGVHPSFVAGTPQVQITGNPGTTLTFRALYTGDDAGAPLSIQFNGLSVRIQGNSSCVPLGTVDLRQGTSSVNTTLVVR